MITILENLCRSKYDRTVDEKVKEELELAGIPVVQLPSYMNSEVKTSYIGILNGFVFTRAWSYWVCEGNMPLDTAKDIYREYKDLLIRAGGHAGNIPPEEESHNLTYEKQLDDLIKEVGVEEYLRRVDNNELQIEDNLLQPRFVTCYHIDTQLGVLRLAEVIKNLPSAQKKQKNKKCEDCISCGVCYKYDPCFNKAETCADYK